MTSKRERMLYPYWKSFNCMLSIQ